MHSDTGPGRLRQLIVRWLRERRYLLLLVAVAILILVLGAWIKPARHTTEVVLSEAERLRLRMTAQKRGLMELSSYLTDVASNAAEHLVWVKTLGQSGLIWTENGLVVTAAPGKRMPETIEVLAGSERMAARPSAFVPGTPVAILQVQLGPAAEAVTDFSKDPPSPGTWIVQVARRADGGVAFAQGIYLGTSAAKCGDFAYQEVETSLPLGHAMLGGGLFDLDGRIVAVVLGCGERVIALSPKSAGAAIVQAQTAESKLLERYGWKLAPLDARAADYFKTSEGALVTEVWSNSLADESGVNPGDIIVNFRRSAVTSPADVEKLQEAAGDPAAGFELKIVRRRRTIDITGDTIQAAKSERSRRPAIVLEPPPEGPLIHAVDPQSPPGRAGIRAGDRILEIGGADPRGRTLSLLVAGGGPPTYVVVERDEKRIGMLVE